MGAYLSNFGEALDRLLNTLIGGSYQQTVSQHAAIAEDKHERWACWLCAWLSATVQRNHCALTLAGAPISDLSRVKAFGQLLAVAVVIVGALVGVVQRIF